MHSVLERIAKKIFLAFTCRTHVMTHGFGYDGADKGLAVFDYRYKLLLWAYPKGDKAKIVHARNASDAFNHLCSHNDASLGEVGKEIREVFISQPRTACLRNFKTLLWNAVMDTSFQKFDNASFLVSRTETVDCEEAKTMLTRQYDFSLHEFYSVFGGESAEEMKFDCEGMTFEVNDSSLKKEDVMKKMQMVKSKLPSFLVPSLLYGDVELKSKFVGNAIADYSPEEDIIRIDSGDEFVTSMIHELGHRWHYKVCKPNQNKALKKLYDECKKPLDSIECSFGDTVVMFGDEYVIMDDDGDHYVCYKVNSSSDSETVNVPKKLMSRFYVDSINGFPIHINSNSLPRHYAGRNIYEFVACCFEHIYGGKPILENVRRRFKEIVEGNGQ